MRIVFLILLWICTSQAQAQESWYNNDQPQELGYVNWLRDYDKALERAKEENKPVLILFQEVPGCSTCQYYGNEILRHPFIVELVESHFIPLAIYNNKRGKDLEILKKYNEPTWNNPVVRIVDEQGENLVSRLAGNYSLVGLADNIRQGLVLSGQTVPSYLELWHKELTGQNSKEEAFLSMYCFWTGEKEIAQIDGILGTEAGFMHGREVVKITYDSNKTDLKKVVKSAEKVQCADQVFADGNHTQKIDKKVGRYRKDREDKFYLTKSPLRFVPMTNLQATKVNSALGTNQDPLVFLSDRQIALHRSNTQQNSYIGEDFVSAWYDRITL